MKKSKKRILALGAATTLVAPVLSVLACSSSYTMRDSKLVLNADKFAEETKDVFALFNDGLSTGRIKSQKMLASAGTSHYLSNDFGVDKLLFMSSSSAGASHINRGVFDENDHGSTAYFEAKKDVLINSGLDNRKSLIQGYGNFNFVNTNNAKKKKQRDAIIKYLLDEKNYSDFVNHAYQSGYVPTIKGVVHQQSGNIKKATTTKVSELTKTGINLPQGEHTAHIESSLKKTHEHFASKLKNNEKLSAKEFRNYFANDVANIRRRRNSPETTYESPDSEIFLINMSLSDSQQADVALIFAEAFKAATGRPAISTTNVNGHMKTSRDSEFPTYDHIRKKLKNDTFDVSIDGNKFKIKIQTTPTIDPAQQKQVGTLGDAWIDYATAANKLKKLGLAYDIYKDSSLKAEIHKHVNQAFLDGGESAVDNDINTLYSLPVLKSTSIMYTNRILLNKTIAALGGDVKISGSGVVEQGKITTEKYQYSLKTVHSSDLANDSKVIASNAKTEIEKIFKVGNTMTEILTSANMLQLAKIFKSHNVQTQNPSNGKMQPLWAYASDSIAFYNVIPSLVDSNGKFNGWTS